MGEMASGVLRGPGWQQSRLPGQSLIFHVPLPGFVGVVRCTRCSPGGWTRLSAGHGHRSTRLVVALNDLPSWPRITGHGDAQARDKIVNLHMIHTSRADRQHAS